MTEPVGASSCAVKGASPEFLMIVECCRDVFDGGRRQQIADLAGRIDWARFVRSARYHRVQGLVWNSLSPLGDAVPAAAATQIASDARGIAAANLRIAVESRQLQAAFTEAGIRLMFMKGLTVGTLAYGDPGMKMGWDIDLLIDAAQIDQAVAVMHRCGYRLVTPAADQLLQSWHRLRKDSEWSNARGIHVELHTRLAENHCVIASLSVHSPSRHVAVAAGIALPTLRHDDLFAYLCLHGASSLWFRLKWITDLAAILGPLDHLEIARLHKRAQELGVGRASSAALLLTDDLYGSLRGSPLRAKLARERGGRWLYQASLRQLAGRTEPREPTSGVGGTVAIHLAQMLLIPGARFKLAEVVRQLKVARAQRVNAAGGDAGFSPENARSGKSSDYEHPS